MKHKDAVNIKLQDAIDSAFIFAGQNGASIEYKDKGQSTLITAKKGSLVASCWLNGSAYIRDIQVHRDGAALAVGFGPDAVFNMFA